MVIGPPDMSPAVAIEVTVPPPPPPDPVFTVILNVLASPFVNVITLLVAEAVNKSDPVLVVPPPPGLFKA